MATPDSQQAIQTILATRNTPTAIDYTPIERGAAVKREAAGKQMQKMDNLIALTAMELPPQMQGDVTSDVSVLLQDVKDGNINVDDIDFNMRMYQIGAKANTYKTNWDQLKKTTEVDPATGRRKAIIDNDENGNPVDLIGDFDTRYLALNKYDPSVNTQDLVAELTDLSGKALYPIPLSMDALGKNIDAFFDLNKDVTASNKRLSTGKDRETYLSSLTPAEHANLVNALMQDTAASTKAEYAAARASGAIDPAKTSFQQYHYNKISQLVPRSRVEEKIQSTQYSPLEVSQQSTLGAGMGQRQLEGGFVANETPVGNIPYVAPSKTGASPTAPKDINKYWRSAGLNVSPETGELVWKYTVQGQDLNTNSKTTAGEFKNITISAPPGVKEKTLKVTTVGGEVVDVSPKNIVVDKNGRGVLVGVSQAKVTEKGIAKPKEGDTFVSTEATRESAALKEHVIKMTPALIKRVNSTFGTDILQDNNDPFGIR
jgi:hypothetical protein